MIELELHPRWTPSRSRCLSREAKVCLSTLGGQGGWAVPGWAPLCSLRMTQEVLSLPSPHEGPFCLRAKGCHQASRNLRMLQSLEPRLAPAALSPASPDPTVCSGHVSGKETAACTGLCSLGSQGQRSSRRRAEAETSATVKTHTLHRTDQTNLQQQHPYGLLSDGVSDVNHTGVGFTVETQRWGRNKPPPGADARPADE